MNILGLIFKERLVVVEQSVPSLDILEILKWQPEVTGMKNLHCYQWD